MILTLAVAIGFHDTTKIGNAYGKSNECGNNFTSLPIFLSFFQKGLQNMINLEKYRSMYIK